jgi:glyoxylase-like metal-dependent hydrolase (beta-lactamase superfamily II)
MTTRRLERNGRRDGRTNRGRAAMHRHEGVMAVAAADTASDQGNRAVDRSKGDRQPTEIAPGVYCLRVRGSNVYFVRSGPSWALIDAAWRRMAHPIRRAAESVFGPAARPAAILLTHAHPDHDGSAAELARLWELPVHVHRADLPLLTGDMQTSWELLDPIGRWAVGLMQLLPRRTFERMTASELKDVACALPVWGAGVPGLPDWKYVPTPGHSAGHVVFFRESDRVLIAGDAVLTAPLFGLLTAWRRISPPPRISSWDWRLAKQSVAVLADLEPRVLACGHGVPLAGDDVARELRDFSNRLGDHATS